MNLDVESETAFLTLITHPPGWAVDDVIEHLADRHVLDEPTLRLRLSQPPPLVLGRIDSIVALHVVESIRRAGGDAFAPTMDQIEALGPTIKIRELELEGDGFRLALWHSDAFEHVLKAHVQVLVRASVDVAQKRIQPVARRTITVAPVIGAISIGSGPPERKLSSTTSSEKLDLHVADGRVLQLDGDKFGYRALGDLRGSSDGRNMDRMLELLEHLLPDVVVDRYFSIFRPPVGARKIRLPRMTINRDDPIFAFYSRWAALMYRHVMSLS